MPGSGRPRRPASTGRVTGDRGSTPHQAVRPLHRRRRRHVPRRQGRDPRLPRPQRGRQDHDDAHPDGLHAGHRRQGRHCRVRHLRSAARGQAPHRLPAGNAAALPGHDRPRLPAVRRPDPRRRVQGAAGAGRHGDGEGARRRRRHPLLRQALEGLQAARRAGPGDPAQPGSPDPGRADRRPRSEADHGDPRPHQGSGGLAHHHPEHAHPARGLADLRARGHHQQGQGGRDRHPGRADRAHPGQPDDLRAGGRAGRGRRRRRARRRARRVAGDAGRPARHAGQLRDRLPQGRGSPPRGRAPGGVERLGPGRAQAVAPQPRRDLPAAHDRRSEERRRPTPPPEA